MLRRYEVEEGLGWERRICFLESSFTRLASCCRRPWGLCSGPWPPSLQHLCSGLGSFAACGRIPRGRDAKEQGRNARHFYDLRLEVT